MNTNAKIVDVVLTAKKEYKALLAKQRKQRQVAIKKWDRVAEAQVRKAQTVDQITALYRTAPWADGFYGARKLALSKVIARCSTIEEIRTAGRKLGCRNHVPRALVGKLESLYFAQLKQTSTKEDLGHLLLQVIGDFSRQHLGKEGGVDYEVVRKLASLCVNEDECAKLAQKCENLFWTGLYREVFETLVDRRRDELYQQERGEPRRPHHNFHW